MVLCRLLLIVSLVLPLAFSGVAHAQGFGFEPLERSLALNPSQQAQFDAAVKATQRALLSIGLGVLHLKAKLGQELLKDRPDPLALEKAQEQLVEAARPHIGAAREEWLRFYALLDERQLETARAYIEERMRRIERLAGNLNEHFGDLLRP